MYREEGLPNGRGLCLDWGAGETPRDRDDLQHVAMVGESVETI